MSTAPALPAEPRVSPLAGKPAPASVLTDIPRLLAAYFAERPDPSVRGERVKIGRAHV